MQISSKCYYALRAVYVLAEHTGSSPLKIAEIAERQKIPLKFLEAILNQLKGGGFVRSWRGAEGGYRLARPADRITVGEVLRFLDGPIAPVGCVSQSQPKECVLLGDCAFFDVWTDVRQAISDVVDRTTFADLVQKSRARVKESAYVANWSI
jgi:Rrf2 family cysteine metabolism transcriptional repressor